MSRYRLIPCCIFLIGLAALALPSRAASTMFLKVDGIKGDATDKAHAGWIAVDSFNAGVTQTGTLAHAGSGAGAGKADIAPLAITKRVDASSPQLFLHACNGKHIPGVVLEVASMASQQPYLRYTLGDVTVSSVRTAGAGAGERPTEEVTFTFAKINMEVMSGTEKGAAGGKSEAGWDLKSNKQASAAPAPSGTSDAGAAHAADTAAPAEPTAPPPAASVGDAPTITPAPSRTLTRTQRDRLRAKEAEPQPAPAPAK
jgi:type VI secretion system secreted protein Hcp